MNKGMKICFIIAASLILFGIIVFGGAMTVLTWDFSKLSTNKYETNTYEISESYKSISIVTDTADIEILTAEDQKTSVVCEEQRGLLHSVFVKDGTLTVELEDTRKWYEHISIGTRSTKITLYLPAGEYAALAITEHTGDVKTSKEHNFEEIDIQTSTGYVSNLSSASGSIKIKTSTGNINVEDVSASALDLSVSTGRITASDINTGGDIAIHVSTGKAYLTDIVCQSLTSSGSTGDISLRRVVASEKFSIERDTGDVEFEACDASEIYVETSTGDVEGDLLSDKVFIVKTDTGKIDVPKTVTGGKCEIITDTGDIEIEIVNK